MQEKNHVSNRHMTWWQKSWWVRKDNGPHLRTARGRRQAWRAATRSAREMGATKKPSVSLEKQKERDWGSGEEEKATRCTSCCTYLPIQLQQQQLSSSSSISSTMTAPNTIMKESHRRDCVSATRSRDWRFATQ